MEISIDMIPQTVAYPLYPGRELWVAIDSSKTNSGITVGTPYGERLCTIEVSSPSSEFVLDLNKNVRMFFKTAFQDARITYVGIEDIITKKGKNGAAVGIDTHESRYKITSVYDNYIFLFEEYFNIRPEPQNNQEWKSAVIPTEYNRKTEKGSVPYIEKKYPRFVGASDDFTDSICIYESMCKKRGVLNSKSVLCGEPTAIPYKMIILPIEHQSQRKAIEYKFNAEFSFEHNIGYIVNKEGTGVLVRLAMGVEDIPRLTLISHICRDADANWSITNNMVVYIVT